MEAAHCKFHDCGVLPSEPRMRKASSFGHHLFETELLLPIWIA